MALQQMSDHNIFSLLGDTIEKIAWQKAGIMKKNRPTFIDPTQAQVIITISLVCVLIWKAVSKRINVLQCHVFVMHRGHGDLL